MGLTDAWERLTARFEPPPCALCGVEGGSRYDDYGEVVDNRIVRRKLCHKCRTSVFLRPWAVRGRWQRV